MIQVIKDLWRGDIPLWKTFWIYNMLVGLPILFLSRQMPDPDISMPSFTLFSVIFFSLVIFIYWVTSRVSLWRAASKYKGRYLWKTLALAHVIVSVLFMVATVVREVKTW